MDKLVIDPHKHTDRQMQTMTIPKGQNWPQVKMSYNITLLKLLPYLLAANELITGSKNTTSQNVFICIPQASTIGQQVII